MEHPEPLTKSVEHLQSMGEDAYLYMLNRKKPMPLLELAKNNGFHVFTHEDKTGIWHILISKNHSDLSAFIDV